MNIDRDSIMGARHGRWKLKALGCYSVALRLFAVLGSLLACIFFGGAYELMKGPRHLMPYYELLPAEQDTHRNEIVLGYFLVFLVFGAMAVFLVSASRRIAQLARDREATMIMENVQQGLYVQFLLYLRPFYLTDKVLEEKFVSLVPLEPSFFLAQRELDLEERLSKTLQGLPRLVAFGKPNETFGAGRVTAQENEWKHWAALLMRRAILIFVLPSVRPGTMWEIDYIVKNGLTYKTLFIMPHAPMRRVWWRRNELTHEIKEDWLAAQQRLEGIGLSLPEYDTSGLIFRFEKDGTVRYSISLRSSNILLRDNLRKYVHALVRMQQRRAPQSE